MRARGGPSPELIQRLSVSLSIPRKCAARPAPISSGVLATIPPNAAIAANWRGIVKEIKKTALLSASKGEPHHIDVARGTMSDPVKTPSETPNQPAVETPAAAAATSVAATPPNDPTQPKPVTETPAVSAAPLDPAAAAKAATDKAAADKAAADALAAKPADPAAVAATEAQAKAKADADAAAAAKAIPETYDIQLPKPMSDQGLKIDPELLPALTPALKKAGLTQQQLQTVAESFIEFQGKLPQRMLDRDLDLTMKDPDIGGLNYGRTQGHVNAALGAFTHPEFRTLLAKSGLANNLEFVRVFERIGKAMAGDSPARGTPDGAPELSRAERMYGKTSPTQ